MFPLQLKEGIKVKGTNKRAFQHFQESE